MTRRNTPDTDLIGVLRLHDDRPAVRLERSYASSCTSTMRIPTSSPAAPSSTAGPPFICR